MFSIVNKKSYNPYSCRCLMEKEHHVFKLKSKFKPRGDQPAAIANLIEGIKDGKKLFLLAQIF